MLKPRSVTFPLLSRLTALAVASMLCAAPSSSQQEPAAEPPPQVAEVHEGPPEAVIAAGQEDLLANMVGKGGGLPNGCTLTNGNIQHKVLEATYTCPGGEVVVQLMHPDQAGSGATKTDKFALQLKSGSPPDGFIAALAARVHEQEGPFTWTILGGQAPSYPSSTMAIVMGVFLTLVVLALIVRSRARRPAPR